MYYEIKILIIVLFINSCSYPEIIRDELVYDNDFETDLLNIDGGGFKKFNNGTVLGDFNNDGFTIHLDNVGDHEYVFVSLIYTSTELGTVILTVFRK